MSRRLAVLLVLVVAVAVGCAHHRLNDPLERWDKTAGYRFDTLDADDGNSDSLFVCLAFSGGGTRAAALAYGAMQELRATRIVWRGRPTTLLAEVDCISSVSGGSFTAAYYGLFRDELFERFEPDFLRRNITRELVLRALNPVNWFRLASPRFDRIDLAAELYHESVFRGATFRTLQESRRRPFVILNATNMRNGVRFEFTQDQFDFLGSSLDTYPVARAVAASSAFPFLLSPLTLKAYGRMGGFVENEEHTTAIKDFHESPLRHHWARPQLEYLDPAQVQWVHLLDGGLSDNIGLRAVERAYVGTDGFLFQHARAGRQKMERLVLIAVNAKTDPDDDSSLSARAPGIVGVGMKTATTSMENYSFETIEHMRGLAREQALAVATHEACGRALKRACPEAPPLRPLEPAFKTCVIEVSFDAIADADKRRKFLNLPTSFDLPADALDQVVAMGRQLLRESPYFVSLVRALGGEVEGAGPNREGALCP
jgi:predicted acylesterase/phospholipase RssA